jgi:hypothetical protein
LDTREIHLFNSTEGADALLNGQPVWKPGMGQRLYDGGEFISLHLPCRCGLLVLMMENNV